MGAKAPFFCGKFYCKLQVYSSRSLSGFVEEFTFNHEPEKGSTTYPYFQFIPTL